MNPYAERLLENDLYEVIGVKNPPDLIERALQRLQGTGPASPTRSESSRADCPPKQVIKAEFHRRPIMRWLEAACLVIALGGIVWLLWPGNRNQTLPEGVKASAGASYAVSSAAVRLDKGWLLVGEGAPSIVVGDGRVDRIRGRMVIRVGVLPTADELASLRDELKQDLTDKEKEMLMNPRNWLVAAGMAVCVFNGSAVIDGQEVASKKAPDAVAEKKVDPEVKDPAGTTNNRRIRTGLTVFEAYTGTDSDITERGYELIMTDADLQSTLKEHMKKGWDKPPLTVDFKKHMVLAIFLGKCVNTPAVSIENSTATEIVINGLYEYLHVVRFQAPAYQTMGGSDNTTPFGFFVLPLDHSRLALEERVISTMHDSPRWERRQIFDHGAGMSPAVIGGPSKSYESNDTKMTLDNKSIGGDEPLCLWLDSAEKFNETWEKHAPGTVKPWDVDFTKQAVIAVFTGKTLNSRGLKLEQTMMADGARILRFNNDVDMERSAATYTSPCIFLRVAKDERTNVIEFKNHLKLDKGEWIAREKDDVQQWVEKARFTK